MKRVYLDSDSPLIVHDHLGRRLDLALLDGQLARLVALDNRSLCLELPWQPRPCRHCDGTGRAVVPGEGL